MVQRVKKPRRLTSNKGTMLATGSNTNSRLEPVLGPVLAPVLEPVLEPVLAPCKRGLRAAGFRAAGFRAAGFRAAGFLAAVGFWHVNNRYYHWGEVPQRGPGLTAQLDKLSLLVGVLYI